MKLKGRSILMTAYAHFTLEERTAIEVQLNQKVSVIRIAKLLGKSRSAVSREIIRNSVAVDSFGRHGERNRCSNRDSCAHHDLCPGMSHLCRKKQCRYCHKQNCNACCPDYQEAHCRSLVFLSHVCNGCDRRSSCSLRKRCYIAAEAQKAADQKLTDCRAGMNFTEDDICEIDRILSPLIKERGQSIHHIFVSHPEIMQCHRA